MTKVEVVEVPSEVGVWCVAAEESRPLAIVYGGRKELSPYESELTRLAEFVPGDLAYWTQELERFFAEGTVSLEPDFRLVSSAFDRAVFGVLRGVPRGQTTTYGALAKAVGSPGAARAVGGAMARNPLPLLVPCHRVLPEGGKLGAYSAGGPQVKAWLLEREGVRFERGRLAGGSQALLFGTTLTI